MKLVEKRILTMVCAGLVLYGTYVFYDHAKKQDASVVLKNTMPKDEEVKILKELDQLDKDYNAGLKKISDNAKAREKILQDMLAGKK